MNAMKALVVLFSVALAACSTLPDDPAGAYRAAIGDAAVAAPHKVLPLLPLPAGETLAVVAWQRDGQSACAGRPLPCAETLGAGPRWVTLAGEVQSRCRAWQLHGDALRRRLEQLLGLPMDPPAAYRKTTFVEYRVAAERVDRPCLGVDASRPAQPVCTLAAQPTTPAALLSFVGRQMADSYVVDAPHGPGYPYTRLGYTYDWAPTARADHYGASEFIISAQSPVVVVALQATDDYCRAP